MGLAEILSLIQFAGQEAVKVGKDPVILGLAGVGLTGIASGVVMGVREVVGNKTRITGQTLYTHPDNLKR